MVRFARLRTAAILLVVVGLSASAGAQELLASSDDAGQAAGIQSTIGRVTADTPTLQLTERRPAALVPLYASFITLQALDLHSTWYALNHGAVEANPAVKSVAGNTLAMTAVKAAGTAGVIFASEKLRTKNKAAAIGLMIAANSAMSWVVQHNYRAVR